MREQSATFAMSACACRSHPPALRASGGCDDDYGPVCIMTYCGGISNPQSDYYCRAYLRKTSSYNAGKLGHRRSLLQALNLSSVSTSTDGDYNFFATSEDTSTATLASTSDTSTGVADGRAPNITDIHRALALLVPGLQVQDVALTSLEYVITAQITIYGAPDGADMSVLSDALSQDVSPGSQSVKIAAVDASGGAGTIVVKVEIDGYGYAEAVADHQLLQDPAVLDRTAAALNLAWGLDTSGLTAASGTAQDCSLPPVSYPDNACPACPACVTFDVSDVNAYAMHAVSATVPAGAVDETERIMHDAVVSGHFTSALAAAQLASSSSSSDAAGRRKLAAFEPTYSADVAPLTPLQAVRYSRAVPQPGFSYVSAAVSLGGTNAADFGYLQSAVFSAAVAQALGLSSLDDVYIIAVGAASDVIAAATSAAAASRRRALLSTPTSGSSVFSVGFAVGTATPTAVTAALSAGAITAGARRQAGLTEVSPVALIVPPSVDVRQPTDVSGALPLLPLRTSKEEQRQLLGLIALVALLPVGFAAGFRVGRRGASPCGIAPPSGGASGALDGYQRKQALLEEANQSHERQSLAAAAV